MTTLPAARVADDGQHVDAHRAREVAQRKLHGERGTDVALERESCQVGPNYASLPMRCSGNTATDG